MHQLGNVLISNTLVQAALLFGVVRPHALSCLCGREAYFLNIFMEGTKSQRCFMWQAKDVI